MDLHSIPEARIAQHTSTEDPTTQPHSDAVTPDVTDTSSTAPKSLTIDRLQALLQMQRTDPFCECISKQLSNRKAPNMKLISFYMCKDYSTNMSWIQPQNSWL